MKEIVLHNPGDFAEWRTAARALLANGVAPEDVSWRGDAEGASLFGDAAVPAATGAVSLPRELLDIAERVICYRDAAVPARLYRIVWRAAGDRQLLARTTDADVDWLRKADKAIRRDIHKMHAFVRFRRLGQDDAGREILCRLVRARTPDRAAGGTFLPQALLRHGLGDPDARRARDLAGRDAEFRPWRHPRRGARFRRGRGAVADVLRVDLQPRAGQDRRDARRNAKEILEELARSAGYRAAARRGGGAGGTDARDRRFASEPANRKVANPRARRPGPDRRHRNAGPARPRRWQLHALSAALSRDAGGGG